MSEEIFREVDEELREENLLRLWRRFWPYVVGAAVMVVVVVDHQRCHLLFLIDKNYVV